MRLPFGNVLRRIAAVVLPESIKGPLRGRLYGYRAATRSLPHSVVPAPGGFLATIGTLAPLWLPTDSKASLDFHLESNGESVDELAGLVTMAPDHRCFWDVGASDGLFSAIFCAASPHGQAVAYEPVPALAARTREMLERNGFGSRVTVRELALGRSKGERSASLAAGEMLSTHAAKGPGDATFSFSTLDHELAHHPAPDLVKVDVEGFELEVLQGAEQLLAQHRPTLMLEIHVDLIRWSGGQLRDIADLLARHRYECRAVDGTRLSMHEVSHHSAGVFRLVATPAERAP